MKIAPDLVPTRHEALFLFLCGLILVWQLFLPGFIGMASNGDFSKVTGPLCIDAADRCASCFIFFQPNYLRGPNYCYNPHVATSEIAFAWMASSIEQLFGNRARFDIRWASALHALLFLGFYFALLILLRPLPRIGRFLLSLASLWIFADVAVIAYLNSFFTDVPAILGGLTAIVLGLHLTKGSGVRWHVLLLFGLAALLFTTSKGQHGLYGFIPACVAAVLAWRTRDKAERFAGIAVAVALLAGMFWILASTPDWYRAQARYNLVFFKITKFSEAPLPDLLELGLSDSELRLVGSHAFMPDSPMNDTAWSSRFRSRCTYGLVLKFYLHHPARVLDILWSDIRDWAPLRRPVNLSNYQRGDGMPPGARTNRLASWSDLRTWLFERWPFHIVAWFALILVVSPWAATREPSPFPRAVAWTAFIVAAIAAAEFCFASLADGCETERHLFLFHLFTDVTIFLAVLFAASRGRGLRRASREQRA